MYEEHKSNYEGGGDDEIWGEVSDILGELYPRARKKMPSKLEVCKVACS